MRECRENGLEPMRGGVDTLQCQLGSFYHKLDNASKGDVSKSKVGDMVYVSNNGYRSPATATVMEVHRTDEGFVYKIKVKRTGQAEKEELVKEDALRHNVNYDNMYDPQQYYLDYHKRKEQEALAELVKAKDEPKGLKGFLERFHLSDHFEANEEGNVAFLVPKSSSCSYYRIYIYSTHIGLQRSIGEAAEVKFYDSKEELAALLRAQETSHEMSPEECLRECYRLFRSLSQKYNDDSYASWKVKQSVSAAMKCLREKDIYAALKAMEEVKELA